MIRSENISPPLLKKIDELIVCHHPHLRLDDEVYYLGEYTSGKHANYSPMNQKILNYKKEMKRKNYPDWGYKETAIKQVADCFRLSILQTTGFAERIRKALLVPVPPHAIKGDPEHDDRNLRMLQYFMPKGQVHELILQKQSREPLHKSKIRNPDCLESNYVLHPPNKHISFDEIWLFDDVLRNGTHYEPIPIFLTFDF